MDLEEILGPPHATDDPIRLPKGKEAMRHVLEAGANQDPDKLGVGNRCGAIQIMVMGQTNQAQLCLPMPQTW